MSYTTFHNLIGGQWLPALSGRTILNLNPADHTDVAGALRNCFQAARRMRLNQKLAPPFG